MIGSEERCGRDPSAGPWRRGRELFDDYDGGGLLSEELADDLANELVGLGPRRRAGRHRGGEPAGSEAVVARRPEPSRAQPACPQTSRAEPHRSRLTLLRGGA